MTHVTIVASGHSVSGNCENWCIISATSQQGAGSHPRSDAFLLYPWDILIAFSTGVYIN